MTASVPPPLIAGAKQSKSTRPPSSEPESPAIAAHRRPKTRDVASRYLEFSSSSFFQSSSPSSTPKRCQSPSRPAEVTHRPESIGRRQSAGTTTPRRGSLDRRGGGGGEVSAAERVLLNSGRGLYASFQADSYTGSERRSKVNSSPPITPRRGTVEKRKTISKLSEQWPKSLQPSCLSRSVDFTDTRKKKPSGSCNGALQNSMVNNRAVSSSEFENSSCRSSNGRARKLPDCGIVVKATSNGVRRICVDSSPALSPKGVSTTRSEQIRPASPRNFGVNPACSSPRGSCIARGISPSRSVVPPRGISPLRVRSSLSNNTSLVQSFAVNGKKEKSRDNGVADDAHLLKLFHNRLLQWRFANARANAVISAQKIRAERRLYSAWISISKLYDSVRAKRIEMQHLKQNLKLLSILNRQIAHLEEGFVVDQDYIGSLVEAAECLKGSTVCLPVDCAAMVNVQSVKDAISSAVDVMQAMASSICLLLPKVGKISCLAAELGRVNLQEQRMLDVCKELLNTISALQVKECSLRTQAIQLQY